MFSKPFQEKAESLLDVELVGYLQLWTDFTHCSGLSTIGFEQVNTSWVMHELDRMYPKLALKTPEQGLFYILYIIDDVYIT